MADERELLERIAVSLEQIAPDFVPPVEWLSAPAYLWSNRGAQALSKLDALPLEQLRGIDSQKTALLSNLKRLANGAAAHDMLLWGARGMGKSAVIRSAVQAIRQDGGDIALIQVSTEHYLEIARLIEELAGFSRKFVLFIDDLGFGEPDLQANLALRSLLDGGALGRPGNIRVAVTSNRRAIVEQEATRPEELHERDERDNTFALADRFGLTLAFHPCDQATYLKIVRTYIDPLGLEFDEIEAKSWAITRGNRSGRAAYQFACEIAGRAGLAL
ncbi:MAG: DUF815 domain-containing protein [Pseudomonadota bacterium]